MNIAHQFRLCHGGPPLFLAAPGILEKEPECIGYELLQNADDAATQPGLSVDIEFFLLEKYLVVRHNGAHFSPGNVKALCRYGASTFEDTPPDEAEKQLDLKKIGYKGIGFKSVFHIAERVWVCPTALLSASTNTPGMGR